jgi:hypothetical protein
MQARKRNSPVQKGEAMSASGFGKAIRTVRGDAEAPFN